MCGPDAAIMDVDGGIATDEEVKAQSAIDANHEMITWKKNWTRKREQGSNNTSRIIVICCGDIAAVLPIRSNISRKNKRKNSKLPYCCGSDRKPHQYDLNENILKIFEQTYCCGFWQKPQQYIKKNIILIYRCGFLRSILRQAHFSNPKNHFRRLFLSSFSRPFFSFTLSPLFPLFLSLSSHSTPLFRFHSLSSLSLSLPLFHAHLCVFSVRSWVAETRRTRVSDEFLVREWFVREGLVRSWVVGSFVRHVEQGLWRDEQGLRHDEQAWVVGSHRRERDGFRIVEKQGFWIVLH